MKRAFTLIELLVVIAIIAILAAILFPVFAQAKAAAKRTASLSNDKQTALGAIMYGGDSDDVFPIAASTETGGTSGTLNFGSFYYTPWPALINPYVKNYDLFIDPNASPNLAPTGGYSKNAATASSPNYGINPYLIQTVGGVASSGQTPPLTPRSFTAISRPADIAFFSAKYSSSETTGNWYGTYWFGIGTYFLSLAADPPDCYAPGNTLYCAAGWGDNNFYGGAGGTKFLKNVEAAGAWTGGASLRGTKKMLVSFVDGHAASKSPGDMAAGTNYNAAQTNGIPTQSENSVVVNDASKEHYYGVQ
jgi:prepilin-type N-terminal cleavage/methylation domain-containing protein